MTALPRRLAPAPHHAVTVTAPRARRIGSGPGAVLLDGLSPAAAAALDRLACGACDVAGLLGGAPPGPVRDDLVGLLGALRRSGKLVDPEVEARVARTRESALVEVRGDSALAVAVVVGLARAGIGELRPRVGGVIGPDDVVAGLPPSDAGRDRTAALRDALGPTGVAPGRTGPDLLVLAGAPERSPDGVVDHLVVTLRDGRGVVGPLVLSGRGPCLECSASGPGGTGPRTATPHVIAATGALAVGQVLAALDGPVRGGPPPSSWAAELEIDVDGGAITARALPATPNCLCGAVSRAPRDAG